MRRKEMFCAAAAALLPTLVWITLRCASVYFQPRVFAPAFFAIALAADMIFLMPLKIGRAGCFFYKAAGYRFSFRNLFLPFSSLSRYFNAVALAVMRRAVFYIVGGLFALTAALMLRRGSLPLILCGFGVSLVGISALLYLRYRLFLCEFFYALGDSAAGAVFRSVKHTRRSAARVCSLELSFVPKAAVCAAVLPAFFLFPRYLLARARLAKKLIVNF